MIASGYTSQPSAEAQDPTEQVVAWRQVMSKAKQGM